MKILSYCATRSSTNHYEGSILMETDTGRRYSACFHAGNFCLHAGEFFNANSIPFSSKEEIAELRFSLSANGMFVTSDELNALEKAMKEAIISPV